MCRSVVNGRDDFDEAVFHTYFNTKPAEFAASPDLQFLEFLFIQIRRMGIKPGQHAANSIRDQIFILNIFDIVFLDACINFGKLLQLG